jgi:hypothetical protein
MKISVYVLAVALVLAFAAQSYARELQQTPAAAAADPIAKPATPAATTTTPAAAAAGGAACPAPLVSAATALANTPAYQEGITTNCALSCFTALP